MLVTLRGVLEWIQKHWGVWSAQVRLHLTQHILECMSSTAVRAGCIYVHTVDTEPLCTVLVSVTFLSA